MTETKKIINLEEFANGALSERLNEELLKVLDNIADPNTLPNKARVITAKLKIVGDKERNLGNTLIEVSSKLVPAEEIPTKILIDQDSNGKTTGAELKSGVKGQTYMQDDGVYSDLGEKVYDFQSQKNMSEGAK
ncbi:replication terminator protein [Paenalkalicoccus suaedae]|uniref:replication terminator protein n=1 Tax=Paenalkalicoccus suaedae TaxID=2592382 RepID=UPI00201BCB09|nr:replication terminator protein [Paenalkalicoccus suaedae]